MGYCPMKDAKPYIVGSGFVALDIVLSGHADLLIRNYAGGTCGNVLTILSFLGWQARPVARIGKDSAALFLLSDLQRWRVKTDLLQEDETALTPIVVQQNRRKKTGEAAHRFSWRCPKCGNFWPSFRPPTRKAIESAFSVLKGHGVFFFDRLAPATVTMAAKSAADGAVVFFEPSGVGDEKLFERALRSSTIVKYSMQRLKRLPSRYRPGLEIRTLGAEGLEFRFKTDRKWHHLPAVKAGTVVDTSGSGDWVSAGLIWQSCRNGESGFSRLSGRALVQALRLGQALASWNCHFEGARGAMYHISGPDDLMARAKALAARKTPATQHYHPTRLATLAMSSVGELCRTCGPVSAAPK